MDPKPKIRVFLQARILRGRSLGDEESFWDTGAVDSVGILQLIQFLESAFNIKIPEKDVTSRRFGSIRSVSEYVAARTKAVSRRSDEKKQ